MWKWVSASKSELLFRARSFLFLPLHGLKISVQQEVENAAPQSAGKSLKKNHVRKNAREHTQVWPVRLRFLKITGFHHLGQRDAEVATHRFPNQPTGTPCLGHSICHTQGWGAVTSANRRVTVITQTAQQPLPSSLLASTHLSGSGNTPAVASQEPGDKASLGPFPSLGTEAVGRPGKASTPFHCPRVPKICLIEH